MLSLRSHGRCTQIALAQRAVTLAPHNFSYLVHLGYVLAQHGRFEEAQQAFACAEAIAPDHPSLLYRISELHEWRGDIDTAFLIMGTLVARHPETNIYLPRLQYLEQLRRRLAKPEPMTAGAAPPSDSSAGPDPCREELDGILDQDADQPGARSRSVLRVLASALGRPSTPLKAAPTRPAEAFRKARFGLAINQSFLIC